MKRSMLLPAILAVWGVSVVIYRLAGGGSDSTNPGYQVGGDVALVIGLIMVVVGTLYFVRAVRGRG